jgi:hypothetical protein
VPKAPAPGDVASALNSLPASATGADQYLGGTTAQGRVETVWVRAAEGILIDLAVAQPSQRSGVRYASIEFPDPLANGATQARALIPEGETAIGDVVEMRFAHKTIKGAFLQDYFKLIEKDKVTKVVAKAGTPLAKDYEARILARAGGGAPATREVADAGLWKSLPLDQAIRIVRGNGKRNLTVVTDPFCPACRSFEQTLQQVDDVTVHVFMVPVIRPDRAEQSKSVWCSPDRAQAWLDLMLRGVLPKAAPTCENPVGANMALVQSLTLRATPTLIYENGTRSQGNLLASTLRERLARAETGPERVSAR